MSENDSKKILAEQLLNNEKINNLLEMATEYIQCGPDCQANKKEQDLQQKYLDSQTNLKMAPVRLERNRKNYYVYTKGQDYYDDMVKTEMMETIKSIGEKLKTNFDEQIKGAETMSSLLDTTIANSKVATSSLDAYEKMKLKLHSEINDNSDKIALNDRNVYYDDESIDKLKLYNKLLTFIYYFCVIAFMIFHFPKNKIDFAKYGFLTVFLFLYPMFAYSVGNYFYDNGLLVIFYIISIAIVLIALFFILYLLSSTFKYSLITLYSIILKMYAYIQK